MNIWSLSKHDDIRSVLLQLEMQLGRGSFCIEDITDQDYFGVSVYKPDHDSVRAYIHAYGQADHLYGLHLEYPSFTENNFRDELKIYEDQTLEQIIRSLAIHFDIASLEQPMLEAVENRN